MNKYSIHAFLKGNFPISQYYGNNVSYYSQFGLQHGHEGVDFATPSGTELFSPFDGIVVRDVSEDREYGNFVVIWDAVQKCGMWFCHLQDVLVNPSETVKAGQLLGHTNNTGNTTGPHVHVNFVETDENGYRLNTNDGEQGFLNLLDKNLVQILPFPGLSQTDAQTPIPDNTSAEQEQTQPEVAPAPVANESQQPLQADPAKVSVDTLTFEKLVTNSDTSDAVCDFLSIPRNSGKDFVIATLTQQKTDLTKKVTDLSGNYTQNLANYQVMQAGGYSSIEDVQKKVSTLEENNAGLQKELLQVNKANATLAEQLKEKNEEDATAIEMGLAAQGRVKELESMIETIATAHGAKPTLNDILKKVDSLKTLYESMKSQLQKKTITDDIAKAKQLVQDMTQKTASIPSKPTQSAFDLIANLFYSSGQEGGAK